MKIEIESKALFRDCSSCGCRGAEYTITFNGFNSRFWGDKMYLCSECTVDVKAKADDLLTDLVDTFRGHGGQS